MLGLDHQSSYINSKKKVNPCAIKLIIELTKNAFIHHTLFSLITFLLTKEKCVCFFLKQFLSVFFFVFYHRTHMTWHMWSNKKLYNRTLNFFFFFWIEKTKNRSKLFKRNNQIVKRKNSDYFMILWVKTTISTLKLRHQWIRMHGYVHPVPIYWSWYIRTSKDE